MVAAFGAAGTAAQAAARETVFFAFDDHAVPWRDNLHVTLEQAEKYPGNPVLERGPRGAPDHGHAILYGAVLHIDGKFRMWYLGMPDESLAAWKKSRWRPMCYAESDDGVNWIKPDLGLTEVNGSRRNNACLVEGGDKYLTRVDDFLSVIYDADDPDAARRYKCAFIAHPPWSEVRGGVRDVGASPKNDEIASKVRLAMMVTAVSADGLRWRIVGDRPAVDEKLEVSALYRFENFYYAAGQQISPWSWRNDGSDVGRMMVAYRSADFVNWSTAKAIAFSRPGQRTSPAIAGQQTHMGAGLWNRGNVLVGLYGMWQDGPTEKPPGAGNLWGTHIDLGLVISDDGIHFREPVPDHKVIVRGAEGQWDDTALLQGHAFANVQDRTLIWYSHWDTAGSLQNMDIGLATLRRDGFGCLSLHQPHAPGHCVTKIIPASSQPCELFINAEGVTPRRPLRVELVDEFDRPLPEYAGENAAVVDGSSVRAAVTWPATNSRRLPVNRSLALRVCFPAASPAKLYCCYIAAASEARRANR
jgi:hypothetical protein